MTDGAEIYRANAREVAAKVVDGEAVLINLSNGKYYSMTGSGGAIWELLVVGGTVAGMARQLAQRFDVGPDVALRDVAGLVKVLGKEGLVIAGAGHVGEPAALPAAGAAREAYESPHLHTYTDMGELLALDPPMPGLDDIPWVPPDDPASSR